MTFSINTQSQNPDKVRGILMWLACTDGSDLAFASCSAIRRYLARLSTTGQRDQSLFCTCELKIDFCGKRRDPFANHSPAFIAPQRADIG